MTEIFTENVVIEGDQDADTLKVQGISSQTNPLQTWRNDAGDTLAQVSNDGRLEVGDDYDESGTPDSLVEAHRIEFIGSPSVKPKRGFHSLGQVASSSALSSVISWIVQELELIGTAGISALHRALRVKLTNQVTGTMTNADLRAGDFEVINAGGGSGSPVTKMTAIQAGVTNQANAYLTDAVGIGVQITKDPSTGAINSAYGIQVADVDQGTAANYALKTGLGAVSIGDYMEVKRPGSVPGTPATDFMRVYPKSDGKVYAKNWNGTEYDLTGGVAPSVCNGRLTLMTNTPILGSTNVFNATIVHFTAYKGEQIALFDGSQWNFNTLSDISINLTASKTGNTTNGSAVITNLDNTSQFIVGMEVTGTGIPVSTTISSINSATQVTLSANATATASSVSLMFKVAANKNLDIFCFSNSGTPKLEMVAWTNDTARATSLVLSQNQIYCKSGATTRRYIGTVRTTATAGETEYSTSRRLVWNYYNRVRDFLYAHDTTNTWAYATAAWRAANNNTAVGVARVEIVIGVNETLIEADYTCAGNTTSSGANGGGVGIDSTTTNSAAVFFGGPTSTGATSGLARYKAFPDFGYHYIQSIEYGSTGATFYGDANFVMMQTGLMVTGEF